MIREILTLVSDKLPLQYYIQFEKDRQHFLFEPAFQNREAPAFKIIVQNNSLILEGQTSAEIEQQAKQKVQDILSDKIFDRF